MSSVVIIGPAHPLRGGLASFDERLCREFKNSGWDSIIYTFSLQYPSILFPGASQYTDAPKPEGLDIRVCINSINPVNWIRIGYTLKNLAPDLIIVRYWIPFMGPCLATILRIVKKNNHTKIICLADNVIPHEKRPGDHLFNKYFLAVPHGYLVMGESVLHDLHKYLPKAKARLADHPLFDNFGKPVNKKEAREYLKIPATDKLLLFFGFIRKYKGLDILLDAMADEEINKRDIHLLIAGEFYEDEKTYLDQITSLGIGNRIILHTHFIPDSEVRYYLSAADVVVQPYRSATQSGVTPLAYQFEVPTIVTDVGALARLITPGITGLVSKPESKALSKTILEFYDKGPEYYRPGVLEGKLKLSWKSFVDNILELKKELQEDSAN